MGSKGEKHLSRIAMPKTWQLDRKTTKWITRPLPGAHSFKSGMPLNLIFRDLLKYANNSKEVKRILNNNEILVDGIRRKEPRLITGLMDVISIPKNKEHFRVLFNKKGKISLISIKEEESKIKPCKIKGKIALGKKIQLNLYDGKNILVNNEDKDKYKIKDTVVIELPSQKIKEVIKFEKGNIVYLSGGKHIGNAGKIEKIEKGNIFCKIGENLIETSEKYGFVVGKDKSVIELGGSK